MIKENFWIKAASVLLAIGLWMFVISKGRSEVVLPAELEVVNVPEGLVLTTYPEENFVLGISGHERFLRRIELENVRVVIDLTGFEAGEHRYHIGRSDVDLPSPLRLTSVNPAFVELALAEAHRRTIPVRAVLAGRPADGYVVNSIEVVPGEVDILGAKSALRKLRYVETEPVDVSNMTETFEAKVPLEIIKKPYKALVPEVTVRVVVAKESK